MRLPSLFSGLERRIRPFPPGEVTSRSEGQEEVSPAEAGLGSQDVAAIWRATERLYEGGLSPCVALCLRRRGKVVIDRAIGHISGNGPGDSGELVQGTPGDLYNLFSASKMVVAMLVHLLAERGQVDLDAPVADYVPEFSAHGKGGITIAQIMAHRAGIPTMSEPTTLDLLEDRPRVVQLICDSKPSFRPGGRLAYHALTGGYVLGEVVERVTGLGLNQFLAEEIAEPLGFDDFRYGVRDEDVPRVGMHAFTGPSMPWLIKLAIRRALGIDMEDACELSNHRRFLQTVVPAGNLITTPNEACLFMELLLRRGTLGGQRIFAPETVERALLEQSYLELDLTLALPVRYGLGFMLGSRVLSPYGFNSPKSFGHLGFSQCLLWADPERDISAALMLTGKTFVSPGLSRFVALVQTIARRCPRDWGRR